MADFAPRLGGQMGGRDRRNAAPGDGYWRSQRRTSNSVPAVQRLLWQVLNGRPQQDSNLRTRLRRPLLYPLSYGGWRVDAPREGHRGTEQGYQSQGSVGHVLDLRA